MSALQKSYGDFEAVRGIDFEVADRRSVRPAGAEWRGENHDGRDSGRAAAADFGRREGAGVRSGDDVTAMKDRIGVCLQSTNLPDKITVREALALFASFYSRNTDIDTLIDRLQLCEKRNAYYSDAFRRAEAASGAGAGAGERSATGVSGRADHGPGSAGAAGNPQPDQRAARRQADHSYSPRITSRKRSGCATGWRLSIRERSSRWARRARFRRGRWGHRVVEIHTAQPMPLDVPNFEVRRKVRDERGSQSAERLFGTGRRARCPTW